ncbi:uncharacterized protein EV422DRAFT_485556, partial [Fimicolochytrium jonesii]|uniref:uncharacterized protein n=1 Tax=Fimicolochytrium jonesii TaxID=1396493 RepID=UPI0022FED54A
TRISRENFNNRGIGTLLDGYSTGAQLEGMSAAFWMKTREAGVHLRNNVAFLLSHYALLRGELARQAELADLHSVTLEHEGFTDCKALVLVLRQGKTNPFGRIEVSACI